MPSDGFDLKHICFDGRPCPARVRPAMFHRPLAVRRAPRPRPEPSASSVQFARRVLTGAGIDASIYRDESLDRRVAACLRALRVDTVDAATRLLVERPGMVAAAVTSFLIGVTDFFRDPRTFEDAQRVVVPALSASDGPLRIWSAACSSGEELYSFAILLAEAGLLERSQLVGSDCRRDAVAEARSALYSSSAIQSLPAHLRTRYLQAVPNGWRPADRLRERVRWSVADLSQSVEAGPWDVILWRNVAIYLRPESAAQIMTALIGELRPGGFLVLGKAERVASTSGLVFLSRCIYRKPGAEHASRKTP